MRQEYDPSCKTGPWKDEAGPLRVVYTASRDIQQVVCDNVCVVSVTSNFRRTRNCSCHMEIFMAKVSIYVCAHNASGTTLHTITQYCL